MYLSNKFDRNPREQSLGFNGLDEDVTSVTQGINLLLGQQNVLDEQFAEIVLSDSNRPNDIISEFESELSKGFDGHHGYFLKVILKTFFLFLADIKIGIGKYYQPTLTIENIKELKTQLEKNPLYFASLGSKELFHSNFLAWIWSSQPNCFRSIFDLSDNISPETHHLEREKKHIDLMVVNSKTNQVELAIENKVKDAPKLKQLRDYSDKLKDDTYCQKILLTLVQPSNNITENQTDWSVLTYEKAAERLAEWLKQNDVPHHKRTYLADYCRLIEGLSQLIQFRMSDSNYWFDQNTEILKVYEELRFEDTIRKYHASQFESSALKALENGGVNIHDQRFDSGYGLNNKQPTVTFSYASKEKYIRHFIQVEADTYRKAIIVADQNETDNQKLENYIQSTDGYSWIFTPSERHMKDKPVNRYNNKNDGTFIYSYKKIGSGEGQVSTLKLMNIIVEDMRKSIQLLDSVSYLTKFGKE